MESHSRLIGGSLSVSKKRKLKPHVSIIIPCKRFSEYEDECVSRCLSLEYENFDIIVLPDDPMDWHGDEKVRILPTGRVKPWVKRNKGLESSKATTIAFIDSDAYPDPLWLSNAIPHLSDKTVGIVGGPSLTPGTDEIARRAGGIILASRIGAGSLSHRYSKTENVTEVDDLPSSNLLVKREVLEDLHDKIPNHWPGEDTHLCRLVKNHLGMQILYAPNVAIYHHRRPLFRPHLKQVWGYGIHRGYFAKKFPENSRKPIYFAPSVLLVGLVTGLPISLLAGWIYLYVSALTLYFGICILEGFKTHSLKLAAYVIPGIFLTHMTYAVAFLKGLISKDVS